MEMGSEVDITATTSFHQRFVHHLLVPPNRVLINFFNRFQRFAINDSDGTLTCIGLDPPTYLPTRQINLNLLTHELCPNDLSTLIDSCLQDRTLSRRIAEKIVAEAIQYYGFFQPYVMSLYVCKTQQVVYHKEEDKEDEESTCAICLDGFCKNDNAYDLPFCSHRFHDRCIGEWLQSNSSCPLCREMLFEE